MSFLDRLKEKSKSLKTEIIVIYLSMKDNRTPVFAKLLVVLTVSYAVSPVDLIPDFIPVLGYLDDIIILPLLITASIKLIPKEVLSECRIQANENVQLNKKIGIFSAIITLLLWISIIAFIFKLKK